MQAAFEKAIKVITRHSQIIDGVVVNVDDALVGFTVDVAVGVDPDVSVFYSVPIRILNGSQASVIEVPNINSHCLLAFRDNNAGRPQIIMVDSVNQLLIDCTNNVVFNKGNLGGLIKIENALKSWNNIEKNLQDLNSAISSWVPVPNDGGAALKSSLSVWLSESLATTQRTDLEDTNILH
jgi:hypothetical protein